MQAEGEEAPRFQLGVSGGNPGLDVGPERAVAESVQTRFNGQLEKI